MFRRIAFACFVFASASTLANAAETVVIRGCTSGSVDGCMFLDKPASQKYALYASPPRPAVGRGVTVTGTVETGPGLCMFTPAIRVQKWSYNRLRCPK